jgi:tetratricopeptide (TPR) repeat protein
MLKKQLFIPAAFVALIGAGAGAALKWDSIVWRTEQLRGWWLDASSGPRSETLPTSLAVAPDGVTASTPILVTLVFEAAAPTVKPTSVPPTDAPTATPIPLVTPPVSAILAAPKWEKQTINNCGPATLTMYLRFYGWGGAQKNIGEVVHPNVRDKNVRWDELVFYVKTNAGWLDALFRVGGTTESLKRFIANGFPVVIETGYEIQDQGWVGHYLLLTGYDDDEGVFIAQDATAGPNQRVKYEKIDQYWQQFNRLYIVVFPPDKAETVNALLGENADEAVNRQKALAAARAETQSDPANPFAWFNLGSNLNYFDRYAEAAEAFDQARALSLPKRMLFYQFGPYRAYFNVGRYQDVIDLSSFTLDYRPDLEESYFWRGWAEYMLGQKNEAIKDFRSALEVNPTFDDAKTALESLGVAP